MNLLALTFIFPLIGFLILTMGQGRIGEKPATIIGVGAMGLSAVCAFVSILGFDKRATGDVCATLDMAVGGRFYSQIWAVS